MCFWVVAVWVAQDTSVVTPEFKSQGMKKQVNVSILQLLGFMAVTGDLKRVMLFISDTTFNMPPSISPSVFYLTSFWWNSRQKIPDQILWFSVVLTASMQHLHTGPWAHSRLLCPPQNQQPLFAHVTPLPRPEAPAFLLVQFLVCWGIHVHTWVGGSLGDIANTKLKPLCSALSAGTIAPALSTPQTLKIPASPSAKFCFNAISPEPLHVLWLMG